MKEPLKINQTPRICTRCTEDAGDVRKAVEERSYMLEVVPNHFKTQKMCDKAVDCIPWSLAHVPNYFKTQEMCNKAVYKNLCCLKYLPDYLKAGVMCNKEVVKSIRWYLDRPSPPQYLQYLLG